MLTKMQKLANELVEVRGKLNELDDTYRELKTPWEQKREATQLALLEEMRKAQTLSTRYEDFTISRKHSSKAVVNGEFAAIAQLKLIGPSYVIESIAPQALKEIEKGAFTLDGVTVEEREYISVTKAKELPKAA